MDCGEKFNTIEVDIGSQELRGPNVSSREIGDCLAKNSGADILTRKQSAAIQAVVRLFAA